jgi:D-xylose transport system substrate-binding protein
LKDGPLSPSFSRQSIVLLGVLLVLSAVVTGCGDSGPKKVALLVPGGQIARNEGVIRPNFEAKLEEDCEDCEVLYYDAGGDFKKQKKQGEEALSEGADILVIDPPYTEYAAPIVKAAKAEDVPVVNYGQLIVDIEPDIFVSFDDVRNGELQTEALARNLKKAGSPRGPVVMINGEPGNFDEHFFQEGARHGLRAAGVKLAKRYYTPFWEASQAQTRMGHAIEDLGRDGFAGVYTETDGIAEGAIDAMKEAGIDPAERPTTGRGSTLAGLQRILSGEQPMTIYEPVESEASVSAEIAADLAEGRGVPQRRVTDLLSQNKVKVPAILLEPIVVTKSNMKQTVINDDLVSTAKLCAGSYRVDCKAAGIVG